MRWVKKRVTVALMDGTVDVHDYVGGSIGGVDVRDGVLTLSVMDGEYADRKHVRTYPLTSVRDWQVEQL